jgi:hypothetical protein
METSQRSLSCCISANSAEKIHSSVNYNRRLVFMRAYAEMSPETR